MEGMIADRGRRFTRVALPPIRRVDEIADLQLVDTIDTLC